MLAFNRRVNQTIVIDGNIQILIVRVEGGAVRIGIDAPRSVPIRRGELEPKSVVPEYLVQ